MCLGELAGGGGESTHIEPLVRIFIAFGERLAVSSILDIRT